MTGEGGDNKGTRKQSSKTLEKGKQCDAEKIKEKKMKAGEGRTKTRWVGRQKTKTKTKEKQGLYHTMSEWQTNGRHCARQEDTAKARGTRYRGTTQRKEFHDGSQAGNIEITPALNVNLPVKT